jgi:hypothetical protein
MVPSAKENITMKIISILSGLALVGHVASLAGLATGFAALPLFAATVSTYILMIAIAEYGRRPGRLDTRAPVGSKAVAAGRSDESHPLAA